MTLAPSPTYASVVWVTRWTATDAPMPTLPPSVESAGAPAGVALAMLSRAAVAEKFKIMKGRRFNVLT